MARSQEVDWERLDKKKFFVQGAAVFSTLTGALFPLTVIKTRMMALDGAHTGLSGAIYTARDVVRSDGIKGLYRGFGTVIVGAIPARMIYLATLESTKSAISASMHHIPSLSQTFVASSASFVAGAVASLAGQLVVVPVDVISQRLMIMGGDGQSGRGGMNSNSNLNTSNSSRAMSTNSTGTKFNSLPPGKNRINGFTLAQHIVKQEGIRGLYRGFGASVATFVPSSAIWWSAYGGWQAFLWKTLDRIQDRRNSTALTRTEGQLLAVEVAAGVLTGCTSASLTTPLDVVKTRLQTRDATGNTGNGISGSSNSTGTAPTWRSTAAELIRNEGPKGLFRGVAPRMVSTSIWGTVMVTTYEFLKRLCMLPPEEQVV
jgi:solute carrier family 25, member 44